MIVQRWQVFPARYSAEKGSSVELPSNFQFESTTMLLYKGLAKIFPREHAHTAAHTGA